MPCSVGLIFRPLGGKALAQPRLLANLLDIESLTVRFGGVEALTSVSFRVEPGEIVALIGPNGAGKTTLFNCLSRLIHPDSGSITFGGKNLLSVPPHRVARLGIARTFQNLALCPSLTVLETVMQGAHSAGRANFFSAAFQLPGVAREERDCRNSSRAILQRLDLEQLAGHPSTGLPFANLKRIELARALAARPRLLLLDEPAAGLTSGELAEFAQLLLDLRTELGVAVLIVEHLMDLVVPIADRVVVLDFGRKIAEGRATDVIADPLVVEAYLGVPA
jgi:branched-chain amino acid transport system ATP-binding protein